MSVFIYFNIEAFSVSSNSKINYFNCDVRANNSDGWDRPVVRIGDCGSLDPGAIPGPDLYLNSKGLIE